MRRAYRIVTAAAWAGWLLIWLEDLLLRSGLPVNRIPLLFQAAGLVAILSVAAVPVMFLLRALECLRKREKLWLDALLLVGSAMIAWYLWFPAMVWMAGV